MTGRTAVTRRIAVGAALALTAGLGWVGTGTASAAAPLVSCSSSGVLGFSPGLTMVAANNTAKLSGTLTGCTGKGGVKSGTLSGSVPIGSQSCLSVLSPARPLGTGSMTIKWKGGTTSVVKVTLSVAQNDFTLGGPVTKNRFKGRKVSAVMTPGAIVPSNYHCSSPGTVPVTGLTYTGPVTVN